MLKTTILPFLHTFVSQWVVSQHASSSCTQVSFGAFEPFTKGPVPIASNISSQLAAPKFIAGMNTSAGEQWAFDATSATGTSGLLIGFYHDPTYAFLGPGNLRLSLDVVWPNGSTWSLVDYLSHANIDICDQGTTGTWSKTNGPASYSFFMAANNSLALLEFQTPRVRGSVTIRSTVPARFSDGSTANANNAPPSTFNAPALDWAEPIPAGQATVDLTLDGSPLRWDGMGGGERWWAGKGWLDALQGWRAVRAVVGPYVLTYWAPTSRLDAGTLYPSAFLARGGKKVFSATRSGPSISSTDQEPYIEYRGFMANGNLMASVGDGGSNKRGATQGYMVNLVAPREGKRWEFTLTHKNMEFEFDLGDDCGGVAYVGTAVGGEIGDDVYQGVFFNEWVDVTKLRVPSMYVTAASWYYQAKAWVIGH
ncbi:MAG: hypothetical protein M1839_009393 [Geoglossum umbratile]|nr:MAG: hypothetical protein M1839_009393 [Geoglossum umbratile]